MAKNGKVLSIDITNESITIIEITAAAKKQSTVHRVIIFETPEDSYEDGTIREPDKIAHAIREQLTANGISNRNAIFVLSSSKIVNREVMIPSVKPNKIKGIINSNASEYFPVNIEDYVVSHSVLEEVTDAENNKQLRLLAVAAPQFMVKSYYELGALAGLNVVSLDYVGNSMLQLIKTQTVANATVMVVQLGSESTVLNIVQGENLLLQRTVPYGTNTVVNTVMDEKGVDATTAMTLLQNERFITVDFDDNEVTGSFRYLINNIGRVMDFFAGKNPDKPIESIYLTGDGALIKGIDGLFKIQLNAETRIMDSLYGINFDKSIDLKIYSPVYLVTSIGAAFAPIGFELGAAGGAAKEKSGLGMAPFVAAVAICACAGAGVAFYALNAKSKAEDKKKQLENDIEAISDINQIVEDWNQAQIAYTDASTMYLTTYQLNENFSTFINELEEKIPSAITVQSFNSTNAGVQMPCVATSYDEIANFIIQLKTIDCVSDATVASLSKQEGEGGETLFNFSVTLTYVPEVMGDLIQSELTPLTPVGDEANSTEAPVEE